MPAADAFVELIGGPRTEQLSAEVVAALSGALVLGWIVFGGHLSRVVDSSDVAGPDLAAAVARVLAGK